MNWPRSRGNPRHLIFRTSWVYATRGANFAKTMFRPAGEKETLSIIDDQHGRPPALSCWQTARRRQSVKRCVIRRWPVPIIWWPAARTSWCDYARYVFEVARAHGAELAVQEVKAFRRRPIRRRRSVRSTHACRMKNSSRHLGDSPGLASGCGSRGNRSLGK